MTEVGINPPGVEAEFERLLRTCFPQWGDNSVSRWFFTRTVGGAPADRLVVAERGALVAGTALTHRRLRLPSGSEVPVGILTGAWTLPRARNRGHFSRLAAEALVLGRERGLALILAFVTDENSSSRALGRLGFAGVPASYHLAEPGAAPGRPAPAAVVTQGGVQARSLGDRARAPRDRLVRIAYATAEEWSSQFLERPHPTRVVRLGREACAVIEEVRDTDRILLLQGDGQHRRALLEALLFRCAARGRKAFLYTTRSEIRRAATGAGFPPTGGCIRIAMADDTVLAAALGMSGWQAPANAGPLVDPSSPWFLGSWDVQAGDKM